MQSLGLDIKVLSEDRGEIAIKEADEDDGMAIDINIAGAEDLPEGEEEFDAGDMVIELSLIHISPSATLLAGTLGLILGLVVAALVSIIVGLIPIAWISIPVTIFVYLIFGSIGLSIGVKRRGDLANFMHLRKTGKNAESKKEGKYVSPKRCPPNCALPPRGCCVTRG